MSVSRWRCACILLADLSSSLRYQGDDVTAATCPEAKHFRVIYLKAWRSWWSASVEVESVDPVVCRGCRISSTRKS